MKVLYGAFAILLILSTSPVYSDGRLRGDVLPDDVSQREENGEPIKLWRYRSDMGTWSSYLPSGNLVDLPSGWYEIEGKSVDDCHPKESIEKLVKDGELSVATVHYEGSDCIK